MAYLLLLNSNSCIACLHNFSVCISAKNTDSKLATGEDDRCTLHEHLKLNMDKEQASDSCEVAAAALNATDQKHVETAIKDAAKSSDASQNTRWLPGWNLSSLTQLTGAVTSTVKLLLKYSSHHYPPLCILHSIKKHFSWFSKSSHKQYLFVTY